MTTATVTLDELRHIVDEAVGRYGMTTDEFLRADIDDLPGYDLRDLWLMVRGLLTPAA